MGWLELLAWLGATKRQREGPVDDPGSWDNAQQFKRCRPRGTGRDARGVCKSVRDSRSACRRPAVSALRSRATLELAGGDESRPLTALADLGILAKTSDRPESRAMQILKSNGQLAGSYVDLAGVVKDSAAQSTGVWSEQADASMTSADRITAANDAIAAAALKSTETVTAAADDQIAAQLRAAEGYAALADAAGESAAKQAEAASVSADASKTSSDAAVEASTKTSWRRTSQRSDLVPRRARSRRQGRSGCLASPRSAPVRWIWRRSSSPRRCDSRRRLARRPPSWRSSGRGC